MEEKNTYVFFKCVQDESLELPEAFVNSRSPAFLHDGFGRLQMIIRRKKVRREYSAITHTHNKKLPNCLKMLSCLESTN